MFWRKFVCFDVPNCTLNKASISFQIMSFPWSTKNVPKLQGEKSPLVAEHFFQICLKVMQNFNAEFRKYSMLTS